MPKKFDIERFNQILKDNKQSVFAEKISTKEIVLSNGLCITDPNEIRKCKKRVMNNSEISWRENFDKLYSLDPSTRQKTLEHLRKVTSKKGGQKCQEKHYNKIKNNLNVKGGNPWNKGKSKDDCPQLANDPCSERTKRKISEANKGTNNGMYGRKYTKEEKQRKSNYMKQLIASGIFTPNSNNRNTHWKSYFNNKKYRSSWEALYQYFDNEANYETLRIPYYYKGENHVYIVDFVNHNTKQVIEIKPSELCNDEKTKAKIEAAKDWCYNNGYTFLVVDQKFFLDKGPPNNLGKFDKDTKRKIEELYEIKKEN